MDWLKKNCGTEDVEVVLRNQPWVDYVEHRRTGQKIWVMRPAVQVQEFMEQHPEGSYMLTGDFYQHEFRYVGGDFPYMDLTLQELGIPERDVLHVRTSTVEWYVELASQVLDRKKNKQQ